MGETRTDPEQAILDAVNRVLRASLAGADGVGLVQVCSAVARTTTGSAFAVLGKLDPDGRLTHLAVGRNGRCEAHFPEPAPPPAFAAGSPYGQRLAAGLGFVDGTPDPAPERVGLPPDAGPVTALLGIPLAEAGRTVGLMVVGNRAGGYGPDQEAALAALAPAVATVLLRYSAERRLHTAAAASERRYQVLIENTAEGVAISDDKSILRFANRAFAAILGAPAEELVGTPVIDLVAPEDRAGFATRRRELLASPGASMRSVIRLRRRDGAVRWIDSIATNLLHDPAIAGVISNFQDITARRRAEEVLRHSEWRFRQLHESLPDAFAGVGMDGRLTEVNDAYCQMLGYSREELLRLTYVDVTPERWHEMEARIVREQIVPAGHSAVYEKEYRRRDGTVFPVELRTFLVRDEAGQPEGMWAIVRDITERRQAEAAVHELAGRLQALSENLADGMVYQIDSGLDGKGRRFSYLSPAVERLHGLTTEEVLRDPTLIYGQVLAEDLPRLAAREAECFATHTPLDIDVQVRLPSGEVRWRRFASAPRVLPDGHVVWDGIELDITDRKRAEEALRELTARLLRLQDEERHRLARELHDTTAQELVALSMNLSALSTAAPRLSAQARKLLSDSLDLAQHCASQVRTQSYLLHPPGLDELGLAGTVREYADGFARRSGLRVDLELAPDLPRLPRDTELALFRVLQEALANVHRHSGSPSASIALTCSPTEVRMEVRDKGHGLPPAGAPGRTSGLGVGTLGMRERLRQLGGNLHIHSSPHGTTVTATVPRSAP